MRTYYLGFTYHNKRMLFGRLDVPGREQLEAIVRSLRQAFAGCHLANLRTLPIEATDPATLDADEQYRLHCEWDDQERLIGVLARDPRLCDERLHVLMEAVAILARDQRVRAADGVSSSTGPEPESINLLPVDVAILRALSSSPSLMTQVAIEAAIADQNEVEEDEHYVPCSHAVISKRLARLEGCEIVTRPEGARKGWGLTGAGKRILAGRTSTQMIR